MRDKNRRAFLKTSAATICAVSLPGAYLVNGALAWAGAGLLAWAGRGLRSRRDKT